MKCLVTGGTGLIGSEFKGDNYYKIGSRDCDLTDRVSVNNLLKYGDFKSIIHCAAKVGGVGSNMKYKGEFFYNNIMMTKALRRWFTP